MRRFWACVLPGCDRYTDSAACATPRPATQGDNVAGPRLSIIPGAFALDQRADEAHFRVLLLIGRHTDTEGWCRLKQLTIATEIGLARETVCRKISDLVAWGYVEKHAEDATGRAIWYRTVLDPKVPPPVEADEEEAGSGQPAAEGASKDACETSAGPVSHGSHVGYNAGAELHTTCDPYDHTRCDRIGSQQERSSLTTSLPPNPPAGGTGEKSDWKGRALEAIRATGRHREAVEALLAPLLTSDKRLARPADDPAAVMAELAGQADGIPAPALAAAAKRLLAQGPKITAAHIREQIAVARKWGSAISVAKGSQQWAAWRAHYEVHDPQTASAMANFPTWVVPAAWPSSLAPSVAQHATGAGQPAAGTGQPSKGRAA